MQSWSILQEFADEFISAAEAVGIDGHALLQRLPPAGTLLTGRNVPTCNPRYRGTCSVLLHINRDPQGNDWPYVRFHTFKHGGITTVFHGLALSRSRQRGARPQTSSHQAPVIAMTTASPDAAEQAAWRKHKCQQLLADYFSAPAIVLESIWLQRRLCGYANRALLARIDMRHTRDGRILLPLSHPHHGLIGYHQIRPTQAGDEKRHFVQAQGLLKGAAVLIGARPHSLGAPSALCEGVVTGLTLALLWPGPIYIALSANNLASVRQQLPATQPVCFFADNDQWKPQVGNVGITSARRAAQARDLVLWPEFASEHQGSQPTDFNDLLCCCGISGLQQQMQLGCAGIF